jgi:hypothetical protein
MQLGNKVMENGTGGTSKQNIINIYKNIHGNTLVFVDKEREVTLAWMEAKGDKSVSETIIPSPGGLFEAI